MTHSSIFRLLRWLPAFLRYTGYQNCPGKKGQAFKKYNNTNFAAAELKRLANMSDVRTDSRSVGQVGVKMTGIVSVWMRCYNPSKCLYVILSACQLT